MIRGTTPTHTFKIPIDAERLKEIRILYSQPGLEEPLFVKTKKDLVVEGMVIRSELSQEETLMFDSSKMAEIQLRALDLNDKAIATKPKRISVGRLLEDEVIS